MRVFRDHGPHALIKQIIRTSDQVEKKKESNLEKKNKDHHQFML